MLRSSVAGVTEALGEPDDWQILRTGENQHTAGSRNHMTTADWLRAKIGPAPQQAPTERASPGEHDHFAFFTKYLRPDMRVLQAYCGDGKSSMALAAHIRMGEIVSIDPEISNVRAARSRIGGSGGAEFSFERCSIDDLPFAPGEFDAVLIDGPLATDGSPEKALAEAVRVLAPGGLLGARHMVASSRVLTTPSPLIERALKRQETVMRDVGGDPEVGLRQPGLMRVAGLVNVRVTSATEQTTDDELLSELTRGGFVPLTEPDEAEDGEIVISFVTVVETVGWRPAG